jgi:hypothetical protein
MNHELPRTKSPGFILKIISTLLNCFDNCRIELKVYKSATFWLRQAQHMGKLRALAQCLIEFEHFATLSEGCASQQKLKSSNTVGNKNDLD